MGYWGYLIVGRSERPLAETDALRAVRDGLTPRERRDDGWQVWEYPSGDGDVGSMNTLALETDAPALFGYVMDSRCVVLEAAAPESGAWTTCLAREAMAGYLGAGQGEGDDEEERRAARSRSTTTSWNPPTRPDARSTGPPRPATR